MTPIRSMLRYAYIRVVERLPCRASERQVVSSAGDEVFFKIKRTTKLSKLQGAYANKVGKDVNSIRCVLIRLLDLDDTKYPSRV